MSFFSIMDKTEKCRKLAAEIAAYFKNGICIGSHAKAYIDTCFPDITFRELIERVRGNRDFDTAPLMELIFFPDEALQVRLEPLLEENAFDIDDEKKVTGLLLESDIHTTLRETGSNAAASLKIPAPVFFPFVRRLRISRRIPHRLIDTIHAIFSTTESVRLKVELRNARFAFSPRVDSFLDCFLKGICPEADYFRDCFDLVLALLEERKHGTDPFLLPEAKRDTFVRAKKAAAEFMRRLRHDNMETLMQRGIRAPETGIEEAERKIELLEHIISFSSSCSSCSSW